MLCYSSCSLYPVLRGCTLLFLCLLVSFSPLTVSSRCKAIFAILLASNALVNLNKCYSETFVEEFEVDGGHRVTEPRSDMCLILFSEVPKQCEVLESKGVPKQDCLEIGWMVSWLLRSVKGNNADSVCCICGDERTPSPEVRICALCPTKLRPFWW